jgi:hypothetical protein
MRTSSISSAAKACPAMLRGVIETSPSIVETGDCGGVGEGIVEGGFGGRIIAGGQPRQLGAARRCGEHVLLGEDEIERAVRQLLGLI